MATADKMRLHRDTLDAEIARLNALMRTLELRIETLEGAGMDASAERKQLSETDEQRIAATARRSSLA